MLALNVLSRTDQNRCSLPVLCAQLAISALRCKPLRCACLKKAVNAQLFCLVKLVWPWSCGLLSDIKGMFTQGCAAAAVLPGAIISNE